MYLYIHLFLTVTSRGLFRSLWGYGRVLCYTFDDKIWILHRLPSYSFVHRNLRYHKTDVITMNIPQTIKGWRRNREWRSQWGFDYNRVEWTIVMKFRKEGVMLAGDTNGLSFVFCHEVWSATISETDCIFLSFFF